MSRLQVIAASLADVAARFDVAEVPSFDLPSETIEGLGGMVVIERGERRLLRPATWGFPRMTREMRERDELPGRIGLVADLTSLSGSSSWSTHVIAVSYR